MILIQAFKQSSLWSSEIFKQNDEPLNINHVIITLIPLFKQMKSFKDISHLSYVSLLEGLYLIKEMTDQSEIESLTKDIVRKEWK